MGLFEVKGDALNIGGKKVPIALIGGVAALVGVVVVLRARKQGQNVASLGAVPAAANQGVPGFGAAFAPDISPQLANLNEQLTGIQQSLTAPTVPSAPSAPSAPPVPVPSDFSLQFGTTGTQLSEAGNVVTAFNVNPQLGSEWGGIAYSGEDPTRVYGFLQELFSAYGIGTPPPQTGFFVASGPGGVVQRIPFWAPGHAPTAITR